MADRKHIEEAYQILVLLNVPKEIRNERSCLCLLALLDLTPGKTWGQAQNPLIGITPIMDWAREHYGKNYAPNTRETIRRYSIHYFVQAGIALSNPDDPARPVNSPNFVYQIAPELLKLFRCYGGTDWDDMLKSFLIENKTLAAKYARERKQKLIPVKISPDEEITISSGKHSELIRLVIDDFAPRFVPGSEAVYIGDTGEKWGYFNKTLLSDLGVKVDSHGKMPDVVLYFSKNNWLLLIECATSHGPVSGKRQVELAELFKDSTAGLVYVTAFPNHSTMRRYINEIAWETEVWLSDNPSHMIHFNGERFLGPYKEE